MGTKGTVKTVGVVGLGRMGLPMARNIRAAGFEVLGFDPDPSSAAKARAEGCEPVASLSVLAERADGVLVVVPTDDDALKACSADGGLLAGARPGTVIAVCSSLLPDTVIKISQQADDHEVGVLDVPLTKGVRAAEAGTMTLLVGGEAKHLEIMRPVFEAISTAIHHLGPVGAGQAGKTVNNLLLWGNLATVLEALRLGEALGVPARVLREAMFDCSADSWVLRELSNIQPTWPEKDMINTLRMADAAGADLPMGRVVGTLAASFNQDRINALLDGKS